MSKILLSILFCCYFLTSGFAQKQANIWYFGAKAGLDFNNNSVKPLFDGRLSTQEGCATISDKDGKLLFYTDGRTVWNKNHQIMQNGVGLIGAESTTQAALIVPKPDNINLYYIFSIDVIYYTGSLVYSIVDISKDNGLGSVTTKNSLLLESSTEKITAVFHKNNKDIWVIAHKFDSNEFYSWLMTKDGISKNPIINSVGSSHGIKGQMKDSLNARGYLKASPDGTQLAAAVMVPNNFLEVFDFDNSSGIISNPKKITGFNGSGPYGVEFSPNGRLLYVNVAQSDEIFANQENLYQIPLPVSTGDIADRGLILAQSYRGALQCAPDGKIYHPDNGTLFAINHPDTVGVGCDYQLIPPPLNRVSAYFGLPNFIQSYFREHLTLSAVGNCTSALTTFSFDTDIPKIDSIKWNFSDAPSGKLNISHEINPAHQYNRPGSYYITATIYYQGTSSTAGLKWDILTGPTTNLGNDTTLYYGQNLILDAANNLSIYKWQDGSTNATYKVTTPGRYWVMVSNNSGCSISDTINVKYDQLINVNLPKDTSICVGQSVKLDATLDGATYKWSTGNTSSSITVNVTGLYWVEITNAYHNRLERDTINVHDYQFNDIKAVDDTIICELAPIKLFANGAKKNEKYRWYDAENNFIEQNDGIFQSGMINGSTSYYVELTNGICASEKHRINVKYERPTAKIINRDTVIELGASIQLIATGGKTYSWLPVSHLNNPNIYNPVCKPDSDITYYLTVYSEDGCHDETHINIKIKKSVVVPNAFTPNGDGINDLWVIKYIEQYPKNVIYIFNRNGQLLHNFRNYSNNWDGTYGGQPLPMGVYYYLIELEPLIKQSGYVTILR